MKRVIKILLIGLMALGQFSSNIHAEENSDPAIEQGKEQTEEEILNSSGSYVAFPDGSDDDTLSSSPVFEEIYTDQTVLETADDLTTYTISDKGLTFTVSYPKVLKCGEETTFYLHGEGSDTFKYRLHSLMVYDGNEYVSVYDVSFGSNSSYSTSSEYKFTFYASGRYYIRFGCMDMTTYKTLNTGSYSQGIVLDINCEGYPTVEAKADSIAEECLRTCSSDYEKALWLNDWLIDHAKYDYSYSYCSAEGVLARGTGTCESYHRAYVMLLNRVGIETGRLTGDNHVWTAVKLDGKWYQVDTTWNDTGYVDSSIDLQRLYFGINDEIMSTVHTHSPVTGYESNSLENNYFIKSREILKWSDPYIAIINNAVSENRNDFTIAVSNQNYANVICRLVAYELSNTVFHSDGIDAKATVTFSSEDTYNRSGEYLVHWVPYSYQIVFDANGGTGNMQAMNCSKDQSYQLTGNCYTRKGMRFAGWNTQKDGSGDSYEDEDLVSSLTDENNGIVTLYAQWEAEVYSISYKCANQSFTHDNPVEYYHTSSEIVLKDPIVENGYLFKGWYTADDYKTRVLNIPAGSIGNIELYALIVEEKYGVTYHLFGGTNHIDNPSVYYKDFEYELYPAEREGYSFAGWYTDAAYKYKIDKIPSGIQSEITLYARWKTKGNAGPVSTDIASGTVVEAGTKICLYAENEQSTIHVSVNGSEYVLYEDGIRITEDTIIRAYSTNEKYDDSRIYTFSYTVRETDYSEVDEADMPYYEDGLWTSELETIIYTGKALTQDIRVYDHEKKLELNKDYTLKYANNTKAGTASVTITGKGSYTGSLVKTFRILPLNIEDAEYDHAIVLTSNGKQQKSVPVIKYTLDGKSVTLKNNTDYTLSYQGIENANAFKEPGEYTITVTGKGNYTGSFNITEKIVDAKTTALMSKLAYTIKDVNYQKDTDLIPTELTVKNKTTVLIGERAYSDEDVETLLNAENAGYDYVYQILNKEQAGKAEIRFYGVESRGYAGTAVKNYNIKGTAMGAVKQENFVSSFDYTGNPVEQPAVLYAMVNKVKIYLEEGTDYTVSYQNNTDVGTATVNYTGINGCSGTLKKTYKINGQQITKQKINMSGTAFTYTAEPINPEIVINDGALTEGEDYTLTYTNNVRAGTGTVTITGIHGYTGSVKKTYKINAYNILNDTDQMISVEYSSAVYAKGGSKPEVTVKYGDEVLIAGTDYTVAYSANTAVTTSAVKSQPAIKITGKGNYTGTITKNYVIEAQDISRLKITAADKVYVNKENSYSSVPTITDLDGKTLKSGTDFTVTGYRYADDTELADRNVEAGSEVLKTDIIPANTRITMTVTGKGNYSGEAETTYRIISKSISSAKVSIPEQIYTGRAVTPGKSQITVVVNKQVLNNNEYKIVEYQNNVTQGTAKVVLRGIGEYGGTYTASFKIVQRPVVYTIRYNGNGSTSGSMKNQVVNTISENTLTVNAYKRTGYRFIGWNIEENGCGINYTDRQVYEAEGGAQKVIVLYAQWEKEVYSITYNKDGGVFEEGVLPKESYTVTDSTYVLPEVSKAGYTFNGWYKDASYRTKVTGITAGSTGNMTLYAKFIVIR